MTVFAFEFICFVEYKSHALFGYVLVAFCTGYVDVFPIQRKAGLAVIEF